MSLLAIGIYVCAASATDLFVSEVREVNDAMMIVSANGEFSLTGFPDIKMDEETGAAFSADEGTIVDVTHAGLGYAWGTIEQDSDEVRIEWFVRGSLAREGRLPPIKVGEANCRLRPEGNLQ